MTPPDPSLTDQIQRMQQGDRGAADSVFTQCAARLRNMARALMAKESTNGFQPSDLVQETFVQKVSGGRLRAKIANREHFFSLMAAGMRQVLTDRGRVRHAAKRQAPAAAALVKVLRADGRRDELELALGKLERLDPAGREMIRQKYEQGLTWEELSEQTGKPVSQLRAEGQYVVDWLRRELR